MLMETDMKEKRKLKVFRCTKCGRFRKGYVNEPCPNCGSLNITVMADLRVVEPVENKEVSLP